MHIFTDQTLYETWPLQSPGSICRSQSLWECHIQYSSIFLSWNMWRPLFVEAPGRLSILPIPKSGPGSQWNLFNIKKHVAGWQRYRQWERCRAQGLISLPWIHRSGGRWLPPPPPASNPSSLVVMPIGAGDHGSQLFTILDTPIQWIIWAFSLSLARWKLYAELSAYVYFSFHRSVQLLLNAPFLSASRYNCVCQKHEDVREINPISTRKWEICKWKYTICFCMDRSITLSICRRTNVITVSTLITHY